MSSLLTSKQHDKTIDLNWRCRVKFFSRAFAGLFSIGTKMRAGALIYIVVLLMNGCIRLHSRLLTNTAELDDLLECTQKCNNFPALGFALTTCNPDLKAPFAKDLFYARSFGLKIGVRDVLPNNRTLFCVGSLTKHVTAILVLHLMELLEKRGYNYSVTTLVTDILPAVNFPGSALIDVTIEDILSHRTGLPETFGPFWFGTSKNTTRSTLAEMAAHLPRVHRNREGYLYNNLVFSVAGLIAETLGEKFINATVPWEQLLQQFLLHPLGIAGSVSFADKNDNIDPRRMARPFMSISNKLQPLDPKIMQLISPAGPSGSLCLSPEAMATWMQFILSRGRHGSVEVVSAKTITESWKARVVTPNGNSADGVRGGEGVIVSTRKAYALGWGVGTYRGFEYVGHGGGFYSYLSLLTVFPELNISIFTSSSGPATTNVKSVMKNVHLNIFDRLMGYRSVHHRFCEKQIVRADAPRGMAKIIRQELYSGTYEHPVFGNLTIASNREKLHLYIGRFGNASIYCWTSAVVCELKFHGILWWISGSDAFYSDKETNRTVVFEMCRGRVWRVVLPLYSTDVPSVFSWIPPPGSNDRLECGGPWPSSVRDEHQGQGERLQLSSGSTLKIDQFSGILIFALAVFQRNFVSVICQCVAYYRIL